MALNLKLQLRQSQQLIMTPQLQQAIRLLQLSRLELETLVNQALIENPVLEETQAEDDSVSLEEIAELEKEASPDETTTDEIPLESASRDSDLIKDDNHAETDRDWQEYIESGSGVIPERHASKGSEDNQLEYTLSQTESLREHLLWQLKMSQWSQAERKLGKQLIGNLDEDGYLALSIGEILEGYPEICQLLADEHQQKKLSLSQVGLDLKLLWAKNHQGNLEQEKKSTSFSPEVALAAEAVLQQVQQWDPVGCGTRHLQECLIVQLKTMEPTDNLALGIVKQDLKLLERRDLNKISSKHKIPIEQAIAAWHLITSLEPKPARAFTESLAQNIIPDVFLFHMSNPIKSSNIIGNYRISLNESGLPSLRINEHYRMLAEKSGDNNSLTNQYIQEKIKAGQWLMRSIEQRQKTILRVSQSIVKHQYEFFEHGIDYLKPLVLKDIAEDIGVHESTVSRITTNKYMHTPQGLFELKYFFTSGVGQEDGHAISSKKIKDMILKLVNKEDQRNPYTDIQIADVLNQEFKVKVARRTVAKYREAQNILPSNRRKKLF